MGDLNIGTASANSLANTAVPAISAVLFQDEVSDSTYVLKQQANKTNAANFFISFTIC